MTCAFCGDDLENHTHVFRSDTYGGLTNRRLVQICGTCVKFFELKIRIDSDLVRMCRGHVEAFKPMRQWEDDGGPCLPA